MRKWQKGQIRELLQTLVEAVDELKDLYNKREFAAITMLLADCQNAAENVGCLIEHLEREGIQTVSLLEEYCELLYHISQKKDCKEDTETFVRPLRNQLNAIKSTFEKEIKQERIEVVFFPYKASMWDSLESVWLAAREDVNCDAYVVPIPYYERQSDGTLGQIHYEGDKYPTYVPITNWQEYNVEIRHPDVIFIHSPYDAHNYVTSILPDFYSEQLKKHTDLLVYIPYFVTFGDLPDALCITEGSINADKVIVQSENVRQTYIQAFQRFWKEKGHTKSWKEINKKILALGSPKLDKVVHSTKENFILPERWKQLLIDDNTGSTYKKIVFYNTSLNTILKEDKQYLDKLQSVLEIFKRRTDVVLWWRPHPLSEETFRAMRPELLEQYQQIIAVYCKEGWGIYDNTADLHRAISWCDVYYGDMSSVVELFLVAQKPVMIQAIQDFPISFENLIYIKDTIWFTAFNYNALLKQDCKTGKVDFIGCFPGEIDRFRLFYAVAQNKNRLVFAPLSAEGIAIYRLDTGEFIRIPIKEPQKGLDKRVPYLKEGKFCVCIMYKEYAFLFPATYPAILKLNLETNEVEYLYEPIKELSKLVQHKKLYYFQNGRAEGKIVTLWCIAAGAIVEFDMETYQFKVCFQLKSKENYIEAGSNDTDYWLIPRGKSRTILRVSKDFSHIDSIILSEEIAPEKLTFLYSAVFKENIYFFPGTGKSVIKIDKKNNYVEEVHLFDTEHMEDYEGMQTDWKFFLAMNQGDKILAFNNFAHQLVTYDFTNNSVRNESMKVALSNNVSEKQFITAWKSHFMGAKYESSLMVYEDFRRPLEAFINSLIKEEDVLLEVFQKAWKESRKVDDNLLTGTCGQSIYGYIKTCIEKE